MRKSVTSGSPFEDRIGFTRAVRIGDFVAISGTAPIDVDGSTFAPGDVYQQTRRCFEIALESLAELEIDSSSVIRTRIMLVDIATWEEAAKAHGEIFSKIKPVCTFVGVSAFINPEWLVEIEVDCVVPSSPSQNSVEG